MRGSGPAIGSASREQNHVANVGINNVLIWEMDYMLEHLIHGNASIAESTRNMGISGLSLEGLSLP